jgi:hypothetical protein
MRAGEASADPLAQRSQARPAPPARPVTCLHPPAVDVPTGGGHGVVRRVAAHRARRGVRLRSVQQRPLLLRLQPLGRRHLGGRGLCRLAKGALAAAHQPRVVAGLRAGRGGR